MSHAEIKMAEADASQLTVQVVGLIVAVTQDSIAPTLLAHGMGDRPDVIDSKAKLRVGIECLPHINLTNALATLLMLRNEDASPEELAEMRSIADTVRAFKHDVYKGIEDAFLEVHPIWWNTLAVYVVNYETEAMEYKGVKVMKNFMHSPLPKTNLAVRQGIVGTRDGVGAPFVQLPGIELLYHCKTEEQLLAEGITLKPKFNKLYDFLTWAEAVAEMLAEPTVH